MYKSSYEVRMIKASVGSGVRGQFRIEYKRIMIWAKQKVTYVNF